MLPPHLGYLDPARDTHAMKELRKSYARVVTVATLGKDNASGHAHAGTLSVLLFPAYSSMACGARLQ